MDTLRNIILDEGGGFRQLLRIITVARTVAGAGVKDNITKYAFVLYIIILLKNFLLQRSRREQYFNCIRRKCENKGVKITIIEDCQGRAKNCATKMM